MDITALQKMVASDVAAVRTPLIVIGDVGASICGHVDNIQRLQEVCRANSIWLHCRGHSLAALAVTQGASLPRSDGQPFSSIADSISLTLGNWLALPNLPVVVSENDTARYGAPLICSFRSAVVASANRKCFIGPDRRRSRAIQEIKFTVSVDIAAGFRSRYDSRTDHGCVRMLSTFLRNRLQVRWPQSACKSFESFAVIAFGLTASISFTEQSTWRRCQRLDYRFNV